MMLAGGNPQTMAFFGNLLSAIAGGVTGGFLCATIMLLADRIPEKEAQEGAAHTDKGYRVLAAVLAGGVGSLCYVFCDTAWFSAVESEVYSLAMLLSAIIIWAAMRWSEADESDDLRTQQQAPRWILLVALVLGLGIGVHQLTLLTTPALLVTYLTHRLAHKPYNRQATNIGNKLKVLSLAALFFLIGTTPMLILPIRAAADTPLNEGDPSTWKAYKDYVGREQYSHAPLYPRIWRIRSDNDIAHYDTWCDDAAHPGVKENVQVLFAYQFNYMYLRYLMWNFSGRYNDRQGYGSLQNGQFITGIPPIDKLLVGTGKALPNSMPKAGHNAYFLLPLLLAVIGICFHSSRHKGDFWATFTLFIVSGIGLSVYLNHPVYEPRERDYVYVLSFYAFAIWIGLGAASLLLWLQEAAKRKNKAKHGERKALRPYLALLTLGVPLLMACQNWDDHNRASRRLPRDIAYNYLNECEPNAIFLTYGDNDTFPFWYLQYVEHVRRDVQIINLNLLGTDWYQRQIVGQMKLNADKYEPKRNIVEALNWLLEENMVMGKTVDSTTGDTIQQACLRRPIQISHYAEDQYPMFFKGHTKMVGFSYRVLPQISDTLDCDAFLDNVCNSKWQKTLEDAYIDEITQRFLNTYWQHSLTLVQNLMDKKRPHNALLVLDKLYENLNYCYSDDLRIPCRAQQCYATLSQDTTLSPTLRQQAQQRADCLDSQTRYKAQEWANYYATLPPRLREYIPYTLQPLQEVLRQQQLPTPIPLPHSF